MTKFDNHGFMTREWASATVPGFDGLDPCCQQLITLFPNVPHQCSLVPSVAGFEPQVSLDVPTFVVSKLPKTAGGALGTGVLVGGGHSSKPASVPEPATGLLLAGALLAVMIARRLT